MSLVKKYNVPTPRYTSYPPVPHWDKTNLSSQQWKDSIKQSLATDKKFPNSLSLYLHLPFCEKLCTFCGCNKYITRDHRLEDVYINALLQEWSMYSDYLKSISSQRLHLKELHLGGGTPTFFSSKNLEYLLSHIFENPNIDTLDVLSINKKEKNDIVFSFEAHPNNTTTEHLKTLFSLGFKRVSFGVQDYDEKVQIAINRPQSFEQVKKLTEASRQIGYTSVNHDIVYGLPLQTLSSMLDTIEKTISLVPDRIAFYSYAHVPWLSGTGQRGFSESDLPNSEKKLELYEKGKAKLLSAGYKEIGMDHFALPNDTLFSALDNKTLHRNFMGYTTERTHLLIGLGVSAISDSYFALVQNEKNLKDYYQRIEKKEFPFFRGHQLTPLDHIVRQHILNLFCQFETTFESSNQSLFSLEKVMSYLEEFLEEGLIEIKKDSKQQETLTILPKGKPFVRNIAAVFDYRLQEFKKKRNEEKRIFPVNIEDAIKGIVKGTEDFL